jgi:hypothetical protein
MSKQHTQGPWLHDKRGYPHPDIKAASGRNIACTWGVNNQPKTKEAAEAQKQIARANARRIVACVNACMDVSTEALERYHGNGGIEDATDEDKDAVLNELQAQRDQLLEVLKDIVEVGLSTSRIAAARAAIAKATGAA